MNRIMTFLALVLIYVLACALVVSIEIGIVYLVLLTLGVSQANQELFLILYLMMLYLDGNPGFFKILTSFNSYLDKCQKATEKKLETELRVVEGEKYEKN